MFASVTTGRFHACGVRIDGAVDCWGNSLAGEGTPPAGEFSSVSAGDAHTCGLREDGAVSCWGSNGGLGRTTPPVH
jgi:hypothetical protein